MSLFLTLILLATAEAGEAFWLVPEPIAAEPGGSVTVALVTGNPPRSALGPEDRPRFQRVHRAT